MAGTAEQCSREHRDATAMRHVLAALAAAPRDKAVLDLASILARGAMSRGNHHLAAARGEHIDDALILDPLLDPIFCQCTYRATGTDGSGPAGRPGTEDHCRRFWVPLGFLAAGARDLRVTGMAGGRCPTCHNVFCREHFAHAAIGVDTSRSLCPYDRTPLDPAIHPNGRSAQRIARPRHPVRLVRVLREAPLPPDAPYIHAAIEALAPGSLDTADDIEGCAVSDWSHAESRNDDLLRAYRPPQFDVVTTHAVFDGDRICIVRVLELQPGSDGDVQFPGGEPSGEPAVIETATREIAGHFAAHLDRLRALSRDDDAGIENVSIIVPSDLLSESELRSLDVPRTSAVAASGDDTGAPAAALSAEIEAALTAIRRARFDGAAGTSDPLRPSGVIVLTFSATDERRFVFHRCLLLDLATQVRATSSAQDVPIPGCALDLRGAERSFVEVLARIQAHAGKIRALGEHAEE